MELTILARDLRAERLFAQAELEWVRRLNEKLERAQADLAQASWTQLQQRSLAKRLLHAGGEGAGAGAGAGVCARDERPRCGKPSFVEAHKALRYQDALALASLAQCVRDSPAAASLWLAAAERAGPRALQEAARALAGGLFAREPRRLRRVLLFLARRRRARSPCFARLYAELVDGFRPARPFLAAALGPPVLQLLRSDPDRAGQGQGQERARAASALVALTERFAASLREMWPCFPPSVARVLRQTAAALESDPSVSTEEAHAVCSSLLFAHFLCRAVANPEAYGVTDAPLTAADRFDLGQAAIALQTLCLMKHREPDGDARDLYSRFDKDCVYPLLDALLDDPRFAPSQDDADSDSEEDEDTVETEPRFRPDVALLTRSDVRSLVSSMKMIPLFGADSSSDPSSSFGPDDDSREPSENGPSEASSDSACGVSLSADVDLERSAPERDALSVEEASNLLMGVDRDQIAKLRKAIDRLSDVDFDAASGFAEPNVDSVSPKKKSNGSRGEIEKQSAIRRSQQVLIIKLPSRRTYRPIGMLSESKVLERYYSIANKDCKIPDDMLRNGMDAADGSGERGGALQSQTEGNERVRPNGAVASENVSRGGQEKRTRFSLSHDEGSIGNASDNLEAVSEAASNHSVTSSLEIETEDQNDNLSDMISANVSGRGSPNISGRDTPSSQVTEGDAAPPLLQSSRQQSAPLSIVAANKHAKHLKKARHDIEDKFCKFEIKKLLEGDETFSILSDTWSTDVLASDTETVGESAYERNFITPVVSLTQQCIITEAAENSAPALATPTQPDVFETASESAWSTDALVSDSDRMTEVDMDECNSVTRSENEASRIGLDPTEPAVEEGGVAASHADGDEARAPDADGPFGKIDADLPGTSCEKPGTGSTPDGSATSRWLNDPCQKFPDQSGFGDVPKFGDYEVDYFSGNRIWKNDARFGSPECLFKPIKDESIEGQRKKSRFGNGQSFLDNLGKIASDYAFKSKGKSDSANRSSKSPSNNNPPEASVDVASSGSAVSLSNLSVNSADTSASDKSSSQEVNSENVTERRVTPPPAGTSIVGSESEAKGFGEDGRGATPGRSAAAPCFVKGSSTGAIPKSISFDATAEKNHRHSGRRFVDDSGEGIGINFGDLKNNMKRSGGNILNKIKLFRSKNRHSVSETTYGKKSHDTVDDLNVASLHIREPDETGVRGKAFDELSEDILAKYRRKASSGSDAATSDSASNSGSSKGKNRDVVRNCEDLINPTDADLALDRNDRNNNFENIRRELRIILSNLDMQGIELASGQSATLALICALRLEGCGGGPGASRALAVLAGFDVACGPALLEAVRADYIARRPYAEYLSRCRRSLLASVAALESEYVWQLNEIRRQSALAVATRARISLNSREPRLIALQEKLRAGLVDERRDALFAALKTLSAEIANEDAWAGASEWELEQANLTVERVVMGRVYRQAMFPNGDGDVMRDQLLRNHMGKLSGAVEPPIPGLRSAALLPAERVLDCLSAYKTPRDKVQCVVRFVKCAMNLLSARSDGLPGADDLTPLLVYLLIKANPPSLLSTVQYVNSFADPPPEGEQLYCWTQFCATVEYIKTLD